MIKNSVSLVYSLPGILNVGEKKTNNQITSEILNLVTSIYDVSLGDIISRNRYMKTSEARFVIMYLLRTLTDYSLQEIGDIIQRDHATILYGVRKIDFFLEHNMLSISKNSQNRIKAFLIQNKVELNQIFKQ